jgi:hypothetical protein
VAEGEDKEKMKALSYDYVSDEENGSGPNKGKWTVRQPSWRSDQANNLMRRLQDKLAGARDDEVRARVPRVEGPPSERHVPRTIVNWAVRVPDTLQQQPSTPQNAATSIPQNAITSTPQNASTLTPDPSPHIQNPHQQQEEIMFNEDFEDEENDFEGVIPIQLITPQKTLSSVSPLKILKRKKKKNSQAKRKRVRAFSSRRR